MLLIQTSDSWTTGLRSDCKYITYSTFWAHSCLRSSYLVQCRFSCLLFHRRKIIHIPIIAWPVIIVWRLPTNRKRAYFHSTMSKFRLFLSMILLILSLLKHSWFPCQKITIKPYWYLLIIYIVFIIFIFNLFPGLSI